MIFRLSVPSPQSASPIELSSHTPEFSFIRLRLSCSPSPSKLLDARSEVYFHADADEGHENTVLPYFVVESFFPPFWRGPPLPEVGHRCRNTLSSLLYWAITLPCFELFASSHAIPCWSVGLLPAGLRIATNSPPSSWTSSMNSMLIRFCESWKLRREIGSSTPGPPCCRLSPKAFPFPGHLFGAQDFSSLPAFSDSSYINLGPIKDIAIPTRAAEECFYPPGFYSIPRIGAHGVVERFCPPMNRVVDRN